MFYVHVQNGPVSVKICKQAFLKIHAISNGRLNRALKAVEKSGGSSHQDQRGRHEPVNKTPTGKIELVKEHIAFFPATSSHYSRKGRQLELEIPVITAKLVENVPSVSCFNGSFIRFVHRVPISPFVRTQL